MRPKSCAECKYKYSHDTIWECILESTENSSVDIGEPFNYVPNWCKLRPLKCSDCGYFEEDYLTDGCHLIRNYCHRWLGTTELEDCCEDFEQRPHE